MPRALTCPWTMAGAGAMRPGLPNGRSSCSWMPRAMAIPLRFTEPRRSGRSSGPRSPTAILPRTRPGRPRRLMPAHESVRDGGGLSRLTSTGKPTGLDASGARTGTRGRRGGDGSPTRPRTRSARWCSLGPQNFDEQVFNKRGRDCPAGVRGVGRPGGRFPRQHRRRDAFPDRGQPLERRSRCSSTRDSAGSGVGSRG